MKSFIAFLGLMLTGLLILSPYYVIAFGILAPMPFILKAIVVVTGIVAVRLVRPISIITGNDELKF